MGLVFITPSPLAGSIPLGHQAINPGDGDTPIILSNVICLGNELSLLDCDHASLLETSCDHSKDAGVSCEGTNA